MNKVVDIQFYRAKKDIELLEKKLSELTTARELKAVYKAWLKGKTGSQQ